MEAVRPRDRDLPRDSIAIQRELLQEMHDDHARELEARLVRLLEQPPPHHGGPMRRSIDALLPFLMGLILGVLATYGAFSGRLSTLEANSMQHGAAIREQREDFTRYIAETAAVLRDINNKLPPSRIR